MTVGSQVKGCYSSIKSIEATLDGLSIKTQDEQAKVAYENVREIIAEVKEDLKKQVIYLSIEEPQYK